jgi:hypothetical protein
VAPAVVGAVGWLYLLRDLGALRLGPDVAGALPLQQLAGGDAQPLLRLALAWIPTGAVAARALAAGTALTPRLRAAAVALVAWVLLVVVGAVSDAAAISASVPSHLPAQLARPGTWVAAGLMLAGALLVRSR